MFESLVYAHGRWRDHWHVGFFLLCIGFCECWSVGVGYVEGVDCGDECLSLIVPNQSLKAANE